MLDILHCNACIRHPVPWADDTILTAENVSLWYGQKQALKDVTLALPRTGILAFIGPSGCGKSTMLKCFNRMHETGRDVTITGSIRFLGQDIHSSDIDPPKYRQRFGWVAQYPNPFAKSIYENVAYGPRIHGLIGDRAMNQHVETCLRRACLWDEVKDRLHNAAHGLSIGQQQRLCIARALATDPDVLLMDEPTGSIDPVATQQIEDLIADLGRDHCVVIITHSMMQAKRLSDAVGYFHLGELVELGATCSVFDAPRDPRTRAFIEGAVG